MFGAKFANTSPGSVLPRPGPAGATPQPVPTMPGVMGRITDVLARTPTIGSGPGAQADEDAGSDLFEEMIDAYDQPEIMDQLAVHVRTCFEDAKRHRMSRGVDTDIMRAMRAVDNKYDPEDMELLEGVDIYMGITSQKVRALKSWISDILANSEDKPWTLQATPLPELPPEAEEAVVDALVRELQMYGYTFDLREKAAYFKDIAQKHADKLAATATSRMEKKINDLMTEGDWRDAFTAFLSDVATYPTAFMKGPSIEREPGLRWRGGQLTTVDRLRYRMKRVHPLDFYPSPNSTTPQTGMYCIERSRMTKHELMRCIGVPGFNEMAIRQLVEGNPTGVREVVSTDAERGALEATDTRYTSINDGLYDVIMYYGRLEGEMLEEHGVVVDDEMMQYEAEVWVCGTTVLRAMLNPHPLGTRPFYAGSFDKIPGSLWGRGLPQIVRDIQRVCNSAARSLVRNMSFASGPVGEYDVDRLANESNIDQVRPFRLYAVTTDPMLGGQQSQAIRWHKIDSNAAELLKVYEYYAKLADDASGVPAYVLGNPQVAGAGRTLGGLSMLMGNAAKGVKLVIAGIDRDVIEPVVRNFYALLMMFDPDRTIKADVNVVARGAAGLLQRELSQARAVETLQMLTPYVQAQLVPPDGLQVVLRDVLRGLGYSSDDIIPDPERAQALQNFAIANMLAQNQGGAGGAGAAGGGSAPAQTSVPSIQPGTPPPQLDGRSTPAPNPADQEAIPASPS